ncbi:MAG: TrmH family RNA methyltransferase [Streptosporangiales bacterium]
MGELVWVADTDDPRLADYVALTDAELRQRQEPAGGLFIAEGEKVVRRAVGAGYRLRSLLLPPRLVDRLRDVAEAVDAPAYVAPEPVLERLTGFRVHRGPLASVQRPAERDAADLAAGARRALVLEDVADHVNVGAMFRTAAAFRFDAVLLSPRCADPLYRRAVRVSMGAVLALPWARLPDWYEGPAQLRAAGLRVLALTPAADAEPLARVVDAGGLDRCALLLGTEGDGLSPRWLAAADTRVRIPVGSAVDSLNVAAAAAVACYALANPSPVIMKDRRSNSCEHLS